MHAVEVLQKCLWSAFRQLDRRRAKCLLGAVSALLAGRRLVLMELARAWPGALRVRAPLKRLDRLLGNRHLQGERGQLYGAMLSWLVRGAQPVIVVDWSELKADGSLQLLRAAIPVGGRALTVYEEVHPQRLLGSPRVQRAFLQRLAGYLPSGVRPILISDAGFKTPWFRAVRALGWDYVGRVRGQILVQLPGEDWQRARHCLARARLQPQSFFGAVINRNHPWRCRLVLQRRPARGRHAWRHDGQLRRSRADLRQRRSAREPWLLATSLRLSARAVVALYARRMQIEQAFRDLKSTRYGCALELSLTRRAERIAILLLIHALASFLAWAAGLVSTAQRLTAHCEPQPHPSRRRYSVQRIGWEALRHRLYPLRYDQLLSALQLWRSAPA